MEEKTTNGPIEKMSNREKFAEIQRRTKLLYGVKYIKRHMIKKRNESIKVFEKDIWVEPLDDNEFEEDDNAVEHAEDSALSRFAYFF